MRLKVGKVDIIKIFQSFSELQRAIKQTLNRYYLSQTYHLSPFQAILLDFQL